MRERGKKRLLIIATLLTIAIIGILIIRHNSTPCDYPEIAARGVLNVGMFPSPLSYNADGDSIDGYDYQLLQMIGQHSGLEVKLHQEESFARCMQQLDNRTYDLIACQTPMTSDSTQDCIFSKPLSLNKQVLIQRTDSAGNVVIRNLLELHGCTLHIVQDSPTRLRIENLADEIGDTIYICDKHNHSIDSLIRLVATGAIDYTVCDEFVARVLIKENKEFSKLDMNTAISFSQNYSWCVHPDCPLLLDSLNSWLSRYLESKEYNKIYRKYTGVK
ncbi:MAG: transporter substrate-binding domain-containing protein [Bacteroidaceae bacterium]|nr:transporter substrate-binding domain-containing protein [Bacteroidaceae bacterium]